MTATALIRPGTRVRLPAYTKGFQRPEASGRLPMGTVRGVDDSGKFYAVEFDEKTMVTGHGCTRGDGTNMTQSGRGWWFNIVDPKDALIPIETSKFESAVAQYIAREIGG